MRTTSRGDTDAYLPLKELVGYSGLCVRSLRSYLHHPAAPLPHYRFGSKIVVRRSEFDAWAARFRVTDAAQVEEFVAGILKAL